MYLALRWNLFLPALELKPPEKKTPPGEGGFLRSKWSSLHNICASSRGVFHLLEDEIWILRLDFTIMSCCGLVPIMDLLVGWDRLTTTKT